MVVRSQKTQLAYAFVAITTAIVAYFLVLMPLHVIKCLDSTRSELSATYSKAFRGHNAKGVVVDVDHKYEVQIFSKDPLILYINNFVSPDEIDHVLKLSEGRFETSMVYPGEDAYIDESQCVSKSVYVPRDNVIRRIEKRAQSFQGWRGNNTRLQQMKTQKYDVNSFYNFHYYWDRLVEEGNRVTTFMVYLVANCTGRGTNFPRWQRPDDPRWCNVIECEDDEYSGVTFRPIKGVAVFWENRYLNGSFHRGVRHASLPVKSGEKVGLNIWGWDLA